MSQPPVPRHPRPPARRSPEHRVIAGVAAGLAEHLGLPVAGVRMGMLVLAVLNGVGLALYAALWYFLPMQPPATRLEEVARQTLEGASNPRRPQPTASDDDATGRTWGGASATTALGSLLAVAAVVMGTALLIGPRLDGAISPLLMPLALLAVGVAAIWRQWDDEQHPAPRAAARGSASGQLGRVRWAPLVGSAMILAAAILLLLQTTGPAEALAGVLAGAALTGAAALVALPWIRRQRSALQAERLARAREAERAEVAAHVHDSVLQTLTLIGRHADDPEAVKRLSRAEERRLRSWLYRSTEPSTPRSLAEGLDALAAQVEATYAVDVELVTVGDMAIDDRVEALMGAAGEAVVNAAKHAGGQISVYAEAGSAEVSIYVRDHGAGLDLDKVPSDRHGIRESIIGRMTRCGGSARFRSRAGVGTEVELVLPNEGRGTFGPQRSPPAAGAAAGAPSNRRQGQDGE